jgi:hemerythrin
MDDFVAWSDELSVGIEEIDDQHKELVALVNEMHRAIHERHGSEAVHGILERLADYTRIHFAVEESLMRILHYPDYEAHREQHRELINHMRELREKVATGKTAIGFELMHFLKVWLTRHIMASDKEYGAYFIGMGVKPANKRKSWVGRLWDHLH